MNSLKAPLTVADCNTTNSLKAPGRSAREARCAPRFAPVLASPAVAERPAPFIPTRLRRTCPSPGRAPSRASRSGALPAGWRALAERPEQMRGPQSGHRARDEKHSEGGTTERASQSAGEGRGLGAGAVRGGTERGEPVDEARPLKHRSEARSAEWVARVERLGAFNASLRFGQHQSARKSTAISRASPPQKMLIPPAVARPRVAENRRRTRSARPRSRVLRERRGPAERGRRGRRPRRTLAGRSANWP